MKKRTIKGFRQPNIDETVGSTGSPNEESEDKISIEEDLVALIFDRYAPAETLPESTEQKTTIDLTDEMESTSDISKNKVVMAMKEFSFKLHYTGSEYVWLLKDRSSL